MSKSILIIEDEYLIAEDLKYFLLDLGYEVQNICSNAEEALKEIEKKVPNLILMDIVLNSETDGIELSKKIQKKHFLPIIYITAYGDDQTIDRAKETAPYAFIIKPFERKDLEISIKMALFKFNMELKIREKKKWMSTILKNIGDAVIATDPEGKILFVNPVFIKISQKKESDILGKPLHDIFPLTPYDPVFEKSLSDHPCFEMIFKKETTYFSYQTPQGTQMILEDEASLIRNDQGKLIGHILVLRDITQRIADLKKKNSFEEKLFDIQKLQTLGTLVASIAHDFNNYLAIILNSAQVLELEEHLNQDIKKKVKVIIKSSTLASKLIQQLLRYTSGKSSKKQRLLLSETLYKLMPIIKFICVHQSISSLTVDPNEMPIFADSNQINQLVINTVKNAIEAFSQSEMDSGKIQIRAFTKYFEQETLNTCITANPLSEGFYSCLEIQDNGPGISDEHQKKLFKEFTSSKGSGRGLGLSTVYFILQNHRGGILLDSTQEKGTKFTFLFPIYKNEIED